MASLANDNSLEVACVREVLPRELEVIWERVVSSDAAVSTTEWNVTTFDYVPSVTNLHLDGPGGQPWAGNLISFNPRDLTYLR